MLQFAPLASVEADAVEQLLDRAFEPGRRTRTAYAIRAGMTAIAELSFAALEGDALAGTIQCWPACLTRDDGGRVPLVMVGPVAVEPARQHDGIGSALMDGALAAAARQRLDDALFLIGDPEYYGRFGFTAERTTGWRAPGPVERRRLLGRGKGVPGGEGMLGPRMR